MVEAGVDVVDVGGESTRPGAEPVPVDEEIDRVVPTLEAIQSVPAVADSNVLISVDTRKPAVAAAALDAGADIINDVTGLADPEMREVVADAGCPVVVMHSLDAPVDPTNDPEYDDVVDDVIAALRERLALAETAGIDREKVIVDPGLGFGKSATEAFDLIDRVGEFAALDCPVLIGHSHKSMYGAVGRGEDDREHATVAATALAADRGADIVRAHDIAENRAAVDVAAAVNGSLRERGGADENGDGDPEGRQGERRRRMTAAFCVATPHVGMARRLLLGCSAVGNTLVERTREARGELIAITDDTGWASTLRDRNVATVEADPTDPATYPESAAVVLVASDDPARNVAAAGGRTAPLPGRNDRRARGHEPDRGPAGGAGGGRRPRRRSGRGRRLASLRGDRCRRR